MKVRNSRGQLKIKKSDDFCLSRCRGQLKIKQMAIMLLAIVLFFALVGIFFLMIAISNLKERASELNKEQAISLASRLAGSSEFSCISGAYCIDTDKLMVLRSKPAYTGFWGVSAIEVLKLGNKTRECTLASYPDCELFMIMSNNDTNKIATSFYVSLCRKEYENNYVYDKCELGKLLVYYKRER